MMAMEAAGSRAAAGPPRDAARRSLRVHLRLEELCGTLGGDEGPELASRSAWAQALTAASGLAPARASGRFVSPISLGHLLDGVAEVARAAAGGDPSKVRTVSKRSWDQARLRHQGHDLPSAEAVRKRVRFPWGRVLELALSDRSDRPRLMGQWDPSHTEGWGDSGPDLALRTLRTVALRRGSAPTPFEYDVAVDSLEADSAKRKGEPLLLPSSVYVLSRFSTWSAALQESGLEAPPRLKPRHPAVALADSLDAFVDEFGVLPTSKYFLEWCRRRDIPTTRVKIGWPNVVAELRKARDSRGVSTPKVSTASKCLPPLPPPVPRRRRMAFSHSREEVLASLRRYGDLYLVPGTLPRQRHYMAACRRDRDLVWPNAIGRYGRFHDVCREAGIE